MHRSTTLITLLATMALPAFTTLSACTTAAPETNRAFSRDWASDQRRVANERRVKDRRLYVFGQEMRTPDWLDTNEGRAEVKLGETSNASTAISVDRGELGLRRRWGGNNNNLPAPPGYDERGNLIGRETAEE